MSDTVLDDLALFRTGIPVKLNPHPLFDNYGTPVSREEALNSLRLDGEYKYLLFFGFIRSYKGLDLMIKAFADKRLRKKKLRLVIAGEFYADDTPYRQLIKLYDLEKDIIIHDHFVKDSDVPLYFGIADLVVQPYKTATQSGVTQIAYYYEKPMLVTDVGGLREIVHDKVSGYVVSPVPEDIADAIIDYFENDRQEHFTQGVRKEKGKFSWDKMTASIIEVFDKCITLKKIKS
jgi:glycosyltransferase involved in cell wall biosynthesis